MRDVLVSRALRFERHTLRTVSRFVRALVGLDAGTCPVAHVRVPEASLSVPRQVTLDRQRSGDGHGLPAQPQRLGLQAQRASRGGGERQVRAVSTGGTPPSVVATSR